MEAGPLINRLRRSSPPRRAVFYVTDPDDMRLYSCGVAEIISQILQNMYECILFGNSITQCRTFVHDFARVCVRDLEAHFEAIYWLQRNMEGVMKWCMGFYDHYACQPSELVCEVALYGPGLDMRDILPVELEWIHPFDCFVHVYEAPPHAHDPQGQPKQPGDVEYSLAKVLSKGTIDKDTWDSDWA